MNKKAVVLGLIFCFLFSFNAQAKNVWDMAQSPKYGEKAGGMLGRGLINVVSCPVDIPAGVVQGAKTYKPEFMGGVGGLATGAVCTILRASSGIIDVATFWIPGWNGIPISRTYGTCLTAPEETVAPAEGYVPPSSVYEPATGSTGEGRMGYIKK